MRIVKVGGRKFEKSERKRINKTGTCAMNSNTTNKKNLQYTKSLYTYKQLLYIHFESASQDLLAVQLSADHTQPENNNVTHVK